MRLLALSILSFGLMACGSERLESLEQSSAPTSSVSSTSSSNSSASVPNVSVEYLPCSFCDEGDFTGSLMVISQNYYQTKLAELLNIEVNEHGNDGYSHRLMRFTGQSIFVDDEFARKRINLAIQTFYDTAVLIANENKAVECKDITTIDCADAFIREFVEPLYERTLSDMEVEHYRNTFTIAKAMGEDGQKHGIIAALSSPHFLFRKKATDDQETKDEQ